MGALARLACGYAALTLMPRKTPRADHRIQDQLHAPASRASCFRMVGRVAKAGAPSSSPRAEAYAHRRRRRGKLCATMMQQTLMPVPKTY
jgi:hypothetical protein